MDSQGAAGDETDAHPVAGRLNATAASLLGFLHEGPRTGAELLALAEERIGDFWSLTRSQVYRELAAMATAGLVVAGPPGPRDRREFDISTAGRAAFALWMATVPGPEQIRHPLLLAVSFGEHLRSEQLADFVAVHRRTHAEQLALYDEVADAVGGSDDRFRRAVLEFGRRYEAAMLGWLDELPAVLAGGPTPGPDPGT